MSNYTKQSHALTKNTQRGDGGPAKIPPRAGSTPTTKSWGGTWVHAAAAPRGKKKKRKGVYSAGVGETCLKCSQPAEGGIEHFSPASAASTPR